MKQIDFSLAKTELKRTRELTGRSLDQLSHETGFQVSYLSDLEDFDDLRNAISLGSLWRLCATLEIRPAKLFLAQYPGKKTFACDVEKLPEIINAFLVKTGSSAIQFEEKIGYQISEALKCPPNVWGWNLDCLLAVSEELQIDALCFLN